MNISNVLALALVSSFKWMKLIEGLAWVVSLVFDISREDECSASVSFSRSMNVVGMWGKGWGSAMPRVSADKVSVIEDVSVPAIRSWVIFHLLTRMTAVYAMRCINFSLFLMHLYIHSMFVCGVWGLSASFSHYHIQVGWECSLTAPTSCISVSPSVLKKHKMFYQLESIFPSGIKCRYVWGAEMDLGERSTSSTAIRRGSKTRGHEFQPWTAIVIAQLLTENKNKSNYDSSWERAFSVLSTWRMQ